MRLSSQYEAKLMSRLGNQLSCFINIDIGVEHGADVQRTNRILQFKMYAVSLSFCFVEEQPRTHPVTHSVSVCVCVCVGTDWFQIPGTLEILWELQSFASMAWRE